MSFVRLAGVSFAYSSSVDILTGVTLDLHDGWTGVVGENGSGKTTLLSLIAGELLPTAGSIRREPRDAAVDGAVDGAVHVCPQRASELTAPIREFAAAWTRRAIRLAARLELDPRDIDNIERWPTLSPGERKRWQIGAALAAEPAVLLLDEPTNHLDSAARALLVRALARFSGVGLVVSHDRALLDELTENTVRVHRGGAEIFRGSYSSARTAWQARRHVELQARDRASKREKTLRRRLADERRKRSGAESALSTRKRMKSKKDSDGRSLAARGRAMVAEAKLSRKVSVLRDAAERASAETRSVHIVRERGRSLFIDYQPAPRRYLMALDGETLRAGGKTLLRDVRVAVDRNSRIQVAGPNGAGKTTLLRALLDSSAVDRQRILYLPQVISVAAGDELLHRIRTADNNERGRIMQIASALGLDPERVLATSRPSPGELRKLAIARGLGAGAWAVVLDEPTNHLDLPSIERLETALSDYPGTLVLVSHDRSFARLVTKTVFRLENQRVTIERNG